MDLHADYRRMARRRGNGYMPRTRHLDEHGRAIYTNRLFLETSPYLLQHAHNPVDWYPWGDEAFASARRLDRPVLLSVGYATCHWCHVMEEESFEDEAVARYLNDHYIAVKVDREERPDIDAVYMQAVQAIAGRGGWPMTVWLTPDRRPFYGGTYFPARDGDRGLPVGFLTLLSKIRDSYEAQRGLIDRSAGELAGVVRRLMQSPAGERMPAAAVRAQAVAAAKNRFDALNGGVAGAPKFPGSLPMSLLMRHYRRAGDRPCLDMVSLTLAKMADGGMNDQVGGGFHRYSTDDRWQVPHFEKMLYDNALLVPVYIDGWQATGNARFHEVAAATLDYVAREMTAPDGAFYSATDADSLTPTGRRDEGYYFTWTVEELVETLGPEDARLAAAVYGVDPGGNFEGRSVLYLPRPLDAAAGDMGVATDRLTTDMARIKAMLYHRRSRRPAPLRDEKILAAWNGLMVAAFARAGVALDRPSYIDHARRAARFIRDRMIVDGRLGRVFNDNALRGNGFLDDYAFTIAGLLDLFMATADDRWLALAVDLDHRLDTHYSDGDAGGWFMTADDHEALIAREKPIHDGALPSANAVVLSNLLRLGDITLDAAYRRRAEAALRAFSPAIEAHPGAFGQMIAVLDDFWHPPVQVIVVTVPGDDPADFTSFLRRTYLPGSLTMVVSAPVADRLARRWPLFRNKRPVAGRTTAFVCRQGACRLPVTAAEDLPAQLEG